MSDLTTDSVPLGHRPPYMHTGEGEASNPAGPLPALSQVPRVVNITGSRDIVIGPVFHQPPPRPRPPLDPRHTPTRRQVDALLG
ncbi:hypothetical protein GWK47_045728 [Chionoecetes opilio]|uniref:Uncharacterized protein n=1 Tax=Chionoecetes opilio TaxID=41210 RepID=A0A8J4YEJ7_CHIOP|nr:hypothetical protein GWK47_045728 [Chionoecetes opilio]